MENTILTAAGLIMGFFAWRMALRDPRVDLLSSVLTTAALFATGGCYLSLGLYTAMVSVWISAAAWLVITLQSKRAT